MTNLTRLRGYCIPFGTACRVGPMMEYADAESFSSFLARRARPYLTFGQHDAEPIGGITEIFADGFGLGFRATISDEVWRQIRWQMCRSDQREASSYCSIYMTGLEHERLVSDGRVYHRIKKADIQHVAISDMSVVYQDTGIWPVEVTGEMPPRLARLAVHWDRGYAAHQEIESKTRAAELAATKARLAAKKNTTKPGLPADRMATFEAFRQRLAASLAMGHRPPIMAHAALTKAGGFDPVKFDRQIRKFGESMR
jgi:hypothetical protein